MSQRQSCWVHQSPVNKCGFRQAIVRWHMPLTITGSLPVGLDQTKQSFERNFSNILLVLLI